MEIRELLPSRIESKKAARRILVGVGIALGVLVAGFGLVYLLEWYWVTPGERNAGRLVLAQIDGLQDFDSISREDFEAKEKGLSEKLNAARSAAWTLRDKGVYSESFAYLLVTESERREVFMQREMEQETSIAESDRELSQKTISRHREEKRFYHLLLHKQLD